MGFWASGSMKWLGKWVNTIVGVGVGCGRGGSPVCRGNCI